MNLNLPILSLVRPYKNFLIAGMGGGYDVFCGLPIYFELQSYLPHIHLANLSFSNVAFSNRVNLKGVIRLTDTLVGVTSETENIGVYFPELFLARWFAQKYESPPIIWCFKRAGVQTLWSNYQVLINHLGIDAILLVDGGVDSLMSGDEMSVGTMAEDSISLGAIAQLSNIDFRAIACLGFGAERDICYGQVLENMAKFTQSGGFLGSCSLISEMIGYQLYQEAVLSVQNYQEPSVINSSIISAVQGNFGNYHLTSRTRGSKLQITPFMSIYWFFQAHAIIQNHLFLDQLVPTRTFGEALQVVWRFLAKRTKRPWDKLYF